ncbi:MAG: Rrf2 family transcriptional regulator [Kiloniellaceae bacterium]|jgi:Rrf2 family protein|nr:Rrf2 family transcriptional regulator [Kiloniellaceae bacterium]
MLRLSKKLLFAIEAVVDIAYHAGAGPVRSTDISRRQGIPRRYLEQVLQQLVHHEILAGQRGPKGGYRLARERRRIAVGEIIRIVRKLEGTADPTSEPDGSELGVKVLRPIWHEMQQQMMERFDNMTIEELCDKAREKGIVSEARQITDFTI